VRPPSPSLRQRLADPSSVEDFFRAALDHTAVGIAVVDLEGRFVAVNAAFATMVGRPADELVGRSYLSAIHPDDRAGAIAAAGTFLAGTDDGYESEQRFLRPDGTVHWAHSRVRAVLGPDGERVRFVAVIDDVTAPREAIEALAASEARYRGLVDHLTDTAVFVWTPGLRLKMVAGPALALVGLNPAELEGRPFEEVVDPGDIVVLRPQYEAAARGVASTLQFTSARSGSSYLVDATPLIGPSGDVVEVLTVARNISSLREAQDAARIASDQFRVAFETASVGMAQLALDGRYQRVNETFARLLGYSRDELEQRTAMDVQHGDDRADAMHSIKALAAGSIHKLDVDRRFVHADGSTVWLNANVVAVPGATGEADHLLACYVDVSDRIEHARVLTRQATSDPLTELPNRTEILARLGVAIAVCDRVAVLYLDLDGFKGVNDQYGHSAGDAVLVATAARISTVIRPSDTVGRIGGDEFVVVLPGADLRTAATIAARVEEAVSAPVPVGAGDTARITASIGFADAKPGADPGRVLTVADADMYRVKRMRKDRPGLVPSPSR
jgi:diguanylate cyclase (GGDEF)-like protein/PAS domain S-box-containing protein